MTISIGDVAQAAGVSTATVSRALRGLPHVTDQTRDLVRRVAAELGYVPSRSAAALASGRTRSVALVAPAISRWFFAQAFEGAEQTLRRAGFDALLYFIPDVGRPRPAFDADVVRGRVDAVIVASMAFSPAEAERLRELGLPAVFISVRQPGFPFVGIDDEAAAATATGHLIELGHRVIGHIGGQPDDVGPYSPTWRRRQGWRRALHRAGLAAGPDLDGAGDFSAESGGRAALALLDRRPDLSALFVASDEMALGAIQALQSRGLVVGRDVSVIGLDGHDLSYLMGLTTLAQPAHAQGAWAAQFLLDALADAPHSAETERIFATELIRRHSTGPGPRPTD
ncbi:MAG: LacI family transcriptional regulator [Propionibacteriaceae bacterium]|nr:LacI family transcriptional regulator [Propionibacteriaceae bacterium]